MRIKTVVGINRVYTLFFMNQWVTLLNINGKSSSTDAMNLQDAGINHLNACQKAKENHEYRGRIDAKFLQGKGLEGIIIRTVSDGNDRANRTGLDGDDGSERTEDVSSDRFSSEDKDTFAF